MYVCMHFWVPKQADLLLKNFSLNNQMMTAYFHGTVAYMIYISMGNTFMGFTSMGHTVRAT
jgi:hypothetical protein